MVKLLRDPVAAAAEREVLLPQDLRIDDGERRTSLERHGRFDLAVHRWGWDEAPATVVVVHGGGGNGLLLAPFAAVALREGFAAVAPDLPGFGLSTTTDKASIRYDDWRQALASVLRHEAATHDRPIVLVGASMGGRLAFEAAAETGIPAHLVVTNLLEPTDPAVRPHLSRWPWLGRLSAPMLPLVKPLDRLPVPMRWVSNMGSIANDPAWTDAIVRDATAGGNTMPLGFLRTFLTEPPSVDPATFDACPVTLAAPMDDRWTPVGASLPFLRSLGRVETEVVELERCGHLPIEEPGRSVLVRLVVDRLRAAAGG